jgi:hypothetical protein
VSGLSISLCNYSSLEASSERERDSILSDLIRPFVVPFSASGNEETIPFTRARPLDPKFKTLPPQAQEARLSFVKLAKPGSEYAEEALERFRYLAEGRKLMFVFTPSCPLPLFFLACSCSLSLLFDRRASCRRS